MIFKPVKIDLLGQEKLGRMVADEVGGNLSDARNALAGRTRTLGCEYREVEIFWRAWDAPGPPRSRPASTLPATLRREKHGRLPMSDRYLEAVLPGTRDEAHVDRRRGASRDGAGDAWVGGAPTPPDLDSDEASLVGFDDRELVLYLIEWTPACKVATDAVPPVRARLSWCVPNSAKLTPNSGPLEPLKTALQSQTIPPRAQTLNPKVEGSIPSGGTLETALRRGSWVGRCEARSSPRGRGCLGRLSRSRRVRPGAPSVLALVAWPRRPDPDGDGQRDQDQRRGDEERDVHPDRDRVGQRGLEVA